MNSLKAIGLLATLGLAACEAPVVPDPRVPTTVTVTPDSATLAAIEAVVDLSAKVYDQNGKVMPAKVTWSSDSELVAFVTSNGRVVAFGNGAATVTATAGSATGNAVVTVRQEPVSVSIRQRDLAVVHGETIRMQADARDVHGHLIPGAEFDWTSSDTTIAVIDENGWVLGIREGVVLITVYAGDAYDAVEVPVVNRDRAALTALHHALNGDRWTQNTNWLTDAPLAEWYGVSVDSSGRIRTINLRRNGLSGELPKEIAYLDELNNLSLAVNWIAGEIPAEIGSLTNLLTLSLQYNNLTGQIPPEMARLRLLRLNLEGNRITGPIPPLKFSTLPLFIEVFLAKNELTGGIPPELSETLFWELDLSDNELNGPVPALSAWFLGLNDNELAGPIPEGITRLWSVNFANNPELEGPLPRDFMRTDTMALLYAGGTDLCAPADDEFQSWLNVVGNVRIRRCGHERSVAYLTQAIQSREFPVTLVTGEEALLRVFLTAANEGGSLPRTIATLYVDGVPRQVIDIPPANVPIPLSIDEGQWSSSINALVRGDVVQPRLEMVIDVDPDGTLDSALGVPRRIPETGRMPVAVETMPDLNLTLIPLVYAANPDSSVIDTVAAMAEDPAGHRILEDVRTLLPVPGISVSPHEPVLSDTFGDLHLLSIVRGVRVLEGGEGYYKGLRPGGGGIAYISLSPDHAARSSVSGWHASILAHELGHNMGLYHAPCGNPDLTDPIYPFSDGSIGGWGYDFVKRELVGPDRRDVMSYCDPAWISEYNFMKLMVHRLTFDRDTTATAAATPTLLVWGGTDSSGQPYLDPAFVVDAPPVLPDAAGDHRVSGYDQQGGVLFTIDFAMPGISDGADGSVFAFLLPADPLWADSLAAITISGPGGSNTLERDSRQPMVIIRNPSSGQVRGILRDGARARELARGMDVLVSSGLPPADGWIR